MSFTPPVTQDGWSFASNEFYVEASGLNRHRRATVAELQTVFGPNAPTKDHPAHWYEAQLLHYGLPPSKTKGTAKMRLHEAVTKGGLAVPAHIKKIEADLKKAWTKTDREVKKAVAATATTPAPAKGKKRKADADPGPTASPGVSVNFTMSVNPDGSVQIGGATSVAPAAKKAKAMAPKAAATPASKTATTPATKKTPAAKKAATPAAKTPAACAVSSPVKANTKTQAPRTKTTARRGQPFGVASRSSPNAPAAAPASSPARGASSARDHPQTARRGGSYSAGGRGGFNTGSSSQGHHGGYDEPPPPYSEYADQSNSQAHATLYFQDEDEDVEMRDYLDGAKPSGSKAQHYNDYKKNHGKTVAKDDDANPPPLGLLNGRYEATFPLGSPFNNDGQSGLIMTLDGSALWILFDFADQLRGVMRLDERPWQSSTTQQLGFRWRGEAGSGKSLQELGEIRDDRCWIKFRGGGRVEGRINYFGEMQIFAADRVSGKETRSEMSAVQMRAKWEGFGL